MLNKNLIKKKLSKIVEYVNEIRQTEIKDFHEFRNNVIVKRFIERNLELAIEQAIDICRHIAVSTLKKLPESYSECFELLKEKGIIPEKHAETYKRMAKFRNLLIHMYDTVDDEIVYGIYKKHLSDFDLFISDINQYLQNRSP